MKTLGTSPHAARAVRRVLAAAALGGCVAASPAAGAQAVRGLVIGIDDYAHIPELKGAVNDARDIDAALAGIGAEDVTVLLDGQATRAGIEAAWRGLLERAEEGDTLVLTYAGHGWQEPERVPGSESDGQDEALLLGGFDVEGDGHRERILDDEIHRWLLDAGRKGLRVVFVADSCHSGTIDRPIDSRVSPVAYRYFEYPMGVDVPALDLPAGAVDTGAKGEGALAHVSLLAAELDHRKVPEIRIPDGTGGAPMRGALSHYFARALRGDADVDGDGSLRRDELWSFVEENVRRETESSQMPNLEPRRRFGEVVLRLAPSPVESGPAVADSGEEAPEGGAEVVALAVLNAGADVLAAVREALPGVRLVEKEASPDLVWDARERQVLTRLGDVAAHGVGLDALSGVVGKWRAVRAIGALGARSNLLMRVAPHDGLHRKGDRIEVRVEGLSHPRLTVFSLSGSGRVHYLYPLPGDDPAEVADGSFELPAVVTPPFGADHVVAVSAGSALDGLNAALQLLDGQVAAEKAAALLAEASAQAQGWSSGVQGLYTAPRP